MAKMFHFLMLCGLFVAMVASEEHKQQYDIGCTGTSRDNPKQLFKCIFRKEAFKTLIEHAYTLKVTSVAKNGGYRKANKRGRIQSPDYFKRRTATINVYFKFDFQAPKHCQDDDVTN